MNEYKIRLRFLFIILVASFFILFLRVSYLTFFNNRLSDTKPDPKVQRGIIFDRRGLELAVSQDSSTIGINPDEVYDANFTASKLTKFIDMPEKKISDMILEKEKYFLLKRVISQLRKLWI